MSNIVAKARWEAVLQDLQCRGASACGEYTDVVLIDAAFEVAMAVELICEDAGLTALPRGYTIAKRDESEEYPSLRAPNGRWFTTDDCIDRITRADVLALAGDLDSGWLTEIKTVIDTQITDGARIVETLTAATKILSSQLDRSK